MCLCAQIGTLSNWCQMTLMSSTDNICKESVYVLIRPFNEDYQSFFGNNTMLFHNASMHTHRDLALGATC